MKALSFIADGESYISELNGELCLHPDQLVLEVIEMMLKYDEEALPVYDKDICEDVVHLKELIWFLTCDYKECTLLFHKLNFNLRSAVAIIQRRLV